MVKYITSLIIFGSNSVIMALEFFLTSNDHKKPSKKIIKCLQKKLQKAVTVTHICRLFTDKTCIKVLQKALQNTHRFFRSLWPNAVLGISEFFSLYFIHCEKILVFSTYLTVYEEIRDFVNLAPKNEFWFLKGVVWLNLKLNSQTFAK
jgi:hypothetical protein